MLLKDAGVSVRDLCTIASGKRRSPLPTALQLPHDLTDGPQLGLQLCDVGSGITQLGEKVGVWIGLMVRRRWSGLMSPRRGGRLLPVPRRLRRAV